MAKQRRTIARLRFEYVGHHRAWKWWIEWKSCTIRHARPELYERLKAAEKAANRAADALLPAGTVLRDQGIDRVID